MSQFTLYSLNKKLTLNFDKAFIFTTKYQRKLNKNELHNPLACKLIIQTENSIFQFLLVKSIIISKNNKDIEVYTIFEFEKVTQKIPYFSENSQKFKLLEKIYNSSKVFELSSQEIIDQDLVKTFNEHNRILDLEISSKIGGGF